MEEGTLHSESEKRLYTLIFWLAIFTILYNLTEGVVATLLGYEDETLTLYGFGIDIFIELISGTGIVYMIIRIRKDPGSLRSDFEKTALRVTCFSFYFLVAALTCVLLASSAIYEITGFAYSDAIGTFGLSWFSFKEGQECFEKAKTGNGCAHEH